MAKQSQPLNKPPAKLKKASALAKDQAGIPAEPGKTRGYLMARAVHEPLVRHASVGGAIGSSGFSDEKNGVTDSMAVLEDIRKRVAGGDLQTPVAVLTCQALTLDAIFTDMARRSAMNLGEYPQAADRYMGMALRAQARSCATIEALAKLVRPNEQIVKHVYVDNRGGQAVIAENVTPGGKHGIADQSHDPFGNDAGGPALLSKDPEGHALPVSANPQPEAVPQARRTGRRPKGE